MSNARAPLPYEDVEIIHEGDTHDGLPCHLYRAGPIFGVYVLGSYGRGKGGFRAGMPDPDWARRIFKKLTGELVPLSQIQGMPPTKVPVDKECVCC